jgi:hypothetical protein
MTIWHIIVRQNWAANASVPWFMVHRLAQLAPINMVTKYCGTASIFNHAIPLQPNKCDILVACGAAPNDTLVPDGDGFIDETKLRTLKLGNLFHSIPFVSDQFDPYPLADSVVDR